MIYLGEENAVGAVGIEGDWGGARRGLIGALNTPTQVLGTLMLVLVTPTQVLDTTWDVLVRLHRTELLNQLRSINASIAINQLFNYALR